MNAIAVLAASILLGAIVGAISALYQAGDDHSAYAAKTKTPGRFPFLQKLPFRARSSDGMARRLGFVALAGLVLVVVFSSAVAIFLMAPVIGPEVRSVSILTALFVFGAFLGRRLGKRLGREIWPGEEGDA